MQEPIIVGTSPAGVVWNVYAKASETAEETVTRAASQSTRLSEIWERHEAKIVRVGRMTKSQTFTATDLFPEDTVTGGATFIEGTRADLRRVGEEAYELAEDLDGIRDEVAQAHMADLTESQIDFGAKARQRGLRSLATKIGKAVGR